MNALLTLPWVWHLSSPLPLSARHKFLTTQTLLRMRNCLSPRKPNSLTPKGFWVPRLFLTIRFSHLFYSVLMARDGHQDRLAPNTQPVLSLQIALQFRFVAAYGRSPSHLCSNWNHRE